MIQFYSPDILSRPELGPEEAAHCVKVLRRRPGDIIFVTDGRGTRYECRILSADTRRVSLEILSGTIVKRGWDYSITLAVAPTKNADRMSWLVEKAVEIGVDRICFILCAHSERRNLNVERLRKNAVSAMNQSLKTWLPELVDLRPITSIYPLEGQKFYGYCDSLKPRLGFVRECRPGSDVVVAIGPEGDFSQEEVAALDGAGYRAVTFGDERLRTETAGLYAVTATHIINSLREL